LSYYVYILCNNRRATLYIGVTSDLARRIAEHKEQIIPGFTKKYNVTNLIYVEFFEDEIHAKEREHQVKNGDERRKLS